MHNWDDIKSGGLSDLFEKKNRINVYAAIKVL